MHPVIPPGATFRRAEGLEFVVSLCRPSEVTVHARRQEGTTSTTLTADDAALVAQLSVWQTAEELGVPHERLCRLSDADLLFWSAGRPRRQLTGVRVSSWEGPVALRENVWAKPLILREEKIGPLPFMSRRGMLDGAKVVGARFGVFEYERETHALSLQCCEEHGTQLSHLVPRLDGRSTLAEPGDAEPVLRLLDAFALLESAPAWNVWTGDAQVTWLGHAAVLYEADGTRILVDPLFHPRSHPTRSGLDVPPDPRAIGPVDAVLITHGDNDHCNAQALGRIRRETPVCIPKPTRPMPYQVDMEAMLRVLGFTDVRQVSHWDRFQVGNVRVVTAPFRGEDWGLTLAGCTYLLNHPQLTAYFNADTVSMPDVYQRLASEFRIDVACLGVSGNAETHLMPPGFGYGDFYSVWIPAQKRNQWIELCAGPKESAEAAELLRARYAFGYAAGGTSFMPMTFSDRGTHEEMARILAQQGKPEVAVRLPLGEPFRVPPDGGR